MGSRILNGSDRGSLWWELTDFEAYEHVKTRKLFDTSTLQTVDGLVCPLSEQKKATR
jgi:hypothetical protein